MHSQASYWMAYQKYSPWHDKFFTGMSCQIDTDGVHTKDFFTWVKFILLPPSYALLNEDMYALG